MIVTRTKKVCCGNGILERDTIGLVWRDVEGDLRLLGSRSGDSNKEDDRDTVQLIKLQWQVFAVGNADNVVTVVMGLEMTL